MYTGIVTIWKHNPEVRSAEEQIMSKQTPHLKQPMLKQRRSVTENPLSVNKKTSGGGGGGVCVCA